MELECNETLIPAGALNMYQQGGMQNYNTSGSSDKYLTTRRHTVGPGDTAHEQVRISRVYS